MSGSDSKPSGSTVRAGEPVAGRSTGRPEGGRGYRFPVLLFFGVAIVLYLVVWLAGQLLPASEAAKQPIENRPHLEHFDDQLGPWLWYDSGWYIGIAGEGYSDRQIDAFKSGGQSSVAFFPSYPIVVGEVDRVVGDRALAAIITTFVAGLGFALLFWRWCRDRLTPRGRRVALALLLLYPYSWFLFGTGYADALFLCATLAAFVLLDADHPVLAGVVAVVATAGRPTGAAVVIGLVAVALDRRGAVDLSRERPRVRVHPARLRASDSGVLLAAGGLVAWCAYLYVRTGDAFAFSTVQGAPGWDQPSGPHTWFKLGFFSRIVHVSDPAFTVRLLAQAALAMVFLALIPAVVRKLGWGYGVFTLAIIGIPLVGTGDFQGVGRYLLAAFPVFAVAGDWLAERDKVRQAVLGASATLLVVFSALFASGHYLT
ncbi:MAG: hypothetical protein QOJ67_348 [Acidimicrobiaceae bacterium]|jgi:hypothetical protein